MKKFLQLISPFTGLILLVASLSNFYLAYRASSDIRSTVVTNFVDLVSSPLIASPVSNIVDDVRVFSSPTSSPSTLPSPPPPSLPRQLAEYPYQYFIVGRRIGACMFGRFYYEGSPCSYGKISSIYPDRIILQGGDWILNKTPYTSASENVTERIVKK